MTSLNYLMQRLGNMFIEAYTGGIRMLITILKAK